MFAFVRLALWCSSAGFSGIPEHCQNRQFQPTNEMAEFGLSPTAREHSLALSRVRREPCVSLPLEWNRPGEDAQRNISAFESRINELYYLTPRAHPSLRLTSLPASKGATRYAQVDLAPIKIRCRAGNAPRNRRSVGGSLWDLTTYRRRLPCLLFGP